MRFGGIFWDWLRTFDGFEEVSSGFQTGIGAVIAFGSETHGGTVGTTSSSFCIVSRAEYQLLCLSVEADTTLTFHYNATPTSEVRGHSCHHRSRLSPLAAWQ